MQFSTLFYVHIFGPYYFSDYQHYEKIYLPIYSGLKNLILLQALDYDYGHDHDHKAIAKKAPVSRVGNIAQQKKAKKSTSVSKIHLRTVYPPLV